MCWTDFNVGYKAVAWIPGISGTMGSMVTTHWPVVDSGGQVAFSDSLLTVDIYTRLSVGDKPLNIFW